MICHNCAALLNINKYIYIYICCCFFSFQSLMLFLLKYELSLTLQLFPFSEWLCATQSECLHSTEAPDQQIWIQQLQLGRQLIPCPAPSGFPKAGLVEPFLSPQISPPFLSSTALPLLSQHGHPAVPTQFHCWRCPKREIYSTVRRRLKGHGGKS